MNRELDKKRPLAVVHIDVDSSWAISEHFIPSADRSDCSMYTQAIPRFLAMLDKHQVPATFFCIGEDARRSEQAHIMREIVTQGHEIANHTMNHRNNFSQLSSLDKRDEIIESDTILKDVTQAEIFGFRSSGYYVDDSIIEVLQELGYLYDSSKLPTPALPFMAMALYILSGGFRSRKRLGRLKDSWSNQYPHFVTPNHIHPNIESKLLEIPVSVMPIIRFPFHSTMVFLFGRWLFALGAQLIRGFRLPLVYLFHSVDLLPDTNNTTVKKHPTLKVDFTKRYQIVEYVMKHIQHNFDIVKTHSFVDYYKRTLL